MASVYRYAFIIKAVCTYAGDMSGMGFDVVKAANSTRSGGAGIVLVVVLDELLHL